MVMMSEILDINKKSMNENNVTPKNITRDLLFHIMCKAMWHQKEEMRVSGRSVVTHCTGF